MINISSNSPSFLSIEKLLATREIRDELVKEVLDTLNLGLKKFNILWNPKIFRKALLNGNVPPSLLGKLDLLLKTAVTMNWNIPPSLIEEFDRIIEDVESFNPAFRKTLSAKPQNGKSSSVSKINAIRWK